MANLKALRKRRTTVRSTQQITKAMKMVAAAKLRRAQDAAESARPYAAKLTEMFAAVTADVQPDAHPLLARRDEKRIDVVVLASDRGLCGGYNANLLRRAEGFLREHAGAAVQVNVVGRKGLEYFRKTQRTFVGEQTGILTTPVTQLAGRLAEVETARFAEGETDADGRIRELADIEAGTYRLVFHPDSPFFKRVEAEVEIEAGRDYHVPLLLSPYACAIYRGS